MIYFALNPDGLLYNLGDHKDWESADEAARDPVWIIDEHEALNWASFIQEQTKKATK